MGRSTILVVDDDPLVAKSMARMIAKPSRNVLLAYSGIEALQVLEREDIDLIIADDRMPLMTGRQLLRRARQDWPDMTRILVSGFPSLEVALEALNEEEAHRFLTKPIETDVLNHEVAQSLIRAESARQKRQSFALLDRRTNLLQDLEREHPGVTLLPEQPLRPTLSPLGKALRLAISTGMDLASTFGPEHAVDVVELADQLLLVALLVPRAAFHLEPRDEQTELLGVLAAVPMCSSRLPIALGETVTARLALLAGLDLGTIGAQAGRVAVVGADAEGDILVALRTSAHGLSIEVRRVLERDDGQVSSASDRQAIGPYRLLSPIGEGGIGEVYRALDTRLDRHVAIKMLKVSASAQPIQAARLLREARAACRARSSGVVDVLDFGMLDDEKPFIVMELIEAPTLEEQLKHGALPVNTALELARNIAHAIATAHDAGVVHRDLKPSNIFVQEDNRVKVSDFGAAKVLAETGPALTQEGTTIGTPHYMAPEQARGESVDRRTDIYALGCILFEMLTGHPPFEGTTSLQVITKHVIDPVPTVTSPHGPLPTALVRTVSRALAKKAQERHQNAHEFIADLDQAKAALRRTGWRRWLP